jgi:hypothetical protein
MMMMIRVFCFDLASDPTITIIHVDHYNPML